jgi:hypothetical protein
MLTFSKRTIALARAAGALSLAFDAQRDGEAANAYGAFVLHCTSAKPPIDPAAAYAAAAVADTGPTDLDKQARAARAQAKRDAAAAKQAADEAKRAADAAAAAEAAKAAKPEKPSKPADTERNAAYAERVKLIDELRASVSTLYNGPSLAVRTNPKRFPSSVYADLAASPKHRTELAKLTVRDESALREIIMRGDAKRGTFDPSAINLDAGIFSRLASVKLVQHDADGFSLTADGIAYARKLAKAA